MASRRAHADHQIASAEVEHAISLDDRVAHAAAVPVPDEIMGERVGVAVTLAPGKRATPQSIMAAVEPRLRYAARPAIVVILTSLRECISMAEILLTFS